MLRDDTVSQLIQEEIFGPVLLCMEADSIDGAIDIVNRNKYGNGALIFTTSGVAARKFQTEVEVGQVGINVLISAPFPFSFTSLKSLFAGDLNFDERLYEKVHGSPTVGILDGSTVKKLPLANRVALRKCYRRDGSLL